MVPYLHISIQPLDDKGHLKEQVLSDLEDEGLEQPEAVVDGAAPTIVPTVSAWAGFHVAPMAIGDGSGVVPLTMAVRGQPLPDCSTAMKRGTSGGKVTDVVAKSTILDHRCGSNQDAAVINT